METKFKKPVCPKSALALYLKLYAKKSTAVKNKVDGIKSWVKLSPVEKKHFFSKFEQCKIEHKKRLAKHLKKAHPYLKKKDITRSTSKIKASDASTEVINQSEELAEKTLHNHDTCIDSVIELDGSNENEYANTITDCNISDANEPLQLENNDGAYQGPTLIEPAPLTVRNGKELYETLTENSENNVPWSTLPNTQKYRYRQAVNVLKNEYITRLKVYLESLPSRELFDYYNKHINYLNCFIVT